MSQVGHADSKMTMDVYAPLEQRAKRSHGTNLDPLIRDARTQFTSEVPAPAEREKAPGPKTRESRPQKRDPPNSKKPL